MKTDEKYNQFARAYHSKRLNAETNMWNEFLDYPMIQGLLGNDLVGQTLADLGCGSGIFTERFDALGAKVVGVDFSKELIEIAKSQKTKVQYRVADVANTDLPTDHFDVVVSYLVAHYFEGLEPFFQEAKRILKPHGRFIFSIHHPMNEVISESGEVQNYFHQDSYTWTMLDGMELTSFHHTFQNIFDSLSNAGFVVEQLKESKPDPQLQISHREFFEDTSRRPRFCAIGARAQS